MSQGKASVASVGQWVGVGHRKGRRVVDEGSGGSEDPAGSSQDGGLGISRPFAVVTKGGEAVISNSNRNSVSGNLLANFSGSVNH